VARVRTNIHAGREAYDAREKIFRVRGNFLLTAYWVRCILTLVLVFD
jgi:hypothetical protein